MLEVLHRGMGPCLQTRKNQGLPLPPLPPSIVPRIMVTGEQEVPCSGLGIEWLPGSIWETYPYHRHEVQAMGWKPVSFGEE
jgi:hypothetical protein